MKLRANSIRNGVVIVSIALAALVSGCKPDPEPKRECIAPNGNMIVCPSGLTMNRDAMECVTPDGSIKFNTGKIIKSGKFPGGMSINATTEFVTPDLAEVKMVLSFSKISGYTKLPVCKE